MYGERERERERYRYMYVSLSLSIYIYIHIYIYKRHLRRDLHGVGARLLQAPDIYIERERDRERFIYLCIHTHA